MDVELLLEKYPYVYHMAEDGSWENIYKYGLLSTSALLDLYGIDGSLREQIESSHRPESISIEREGLPIAVVRDQKPMSDEGLKKALLNGLTPKDWYEILNAKTFFWATKHRLSKLMNARAYRNKIQTVLKVDTSKLLEHYYDEIVLCPYNSGTTAYKPKPRDESIFYSIDAYPWETRKKSRGQAEALVEVCVNRGVPNIKDLVVEVSRVHRENTIEILFKAD